MRTKSAHSVLRVLGLTLFSLSLSMSAGCDGAQDSDESAPVAAQDQPNENGTQGAELRPGTVAPLDENSSHNDIAGAAETGNTTQKLTKAPPAELGNPTAWGVVEIKAGKGDVAEYTVKNVGGGTWNYGSSLTKCWSHYVHNEKRHSATAIEGSTNKKVFANATLWANADIGGFSLNTCYAYWATY